MTRILRWAAIAMIAAAAQAAPAMAADPAAAADSGAGGGETPSAQPVPSPFTADDLVLLEVRTDDLEISDGLDAYASRAGVYLPLGQLARLLDLAITVSPPDSRADGWALSPAQTVSVDLVSGMATAQGRTFRLERWQTVQVQDEIYVRSDLLEKLLPLKVKADVSALSLTITPLTPFPFQERLAREQARKGLGAGARSAAVTRVATPYELFTPPSADLVFSLNGGNDATGTTTQYQARLAGDLLYAGAQLYAGSNDRGELTDVRALLERKDPEAGIGPLHATRAGIGDVFSPALALGARGASGRGLYMTSEPIEQPSVLGRIDVRGELQLGWDVELYLNELLFRSQATPVEGRYEFLDVPLSFGLNTLRLVFYGPRGERREEVRRLNFGGGLLAKGRSIVRFGAVEEGVNLIDLGQSAAAVTPLPLSSTPGLGHWRVTGAIDYGLATNLTLSAGGAQYTPRLNDTRQLFTTGVRTSLGGVALLADMAYDSAGGTAASMGAVGRVAGVAFNLRHAEYGAGFVDELRPRNLGGGSPVLRSSEVGLDGQIAMSRGRLDLPVSLLVSRDQLVNGDTFVAATARTSTSLQDVLASASLSYVRGDTAQAGKDERLSGAMDVSGVLRDRWRVRAGLIADLAPELQTQSAVVTLDRDLGHGSALRLGVSHSFVGDESTNLQVGATWRLDMADISTAAGYDTGTGAWRIGFQVSTGLLFDPLQRRYRSARPGVASGGNLALLAFIDENGDGVAQPGEARVQGLKVSGGYRETDTDALGRLIVSALGDGAYVRVRVDPESVDNPFVSLPPTEIQFTPRPGRVTVAPYAMRVTGEVELRMMLRDSEGAAHGLSALGVQLVDAAGKVAGEGRTEYDGTLILEGLPAGTYGVRLDPEQAARLRLSLEAPQSVEIKAGGGFAGTRVAYVRIN